MSFVKNIDVEYEIGDIVYLKTDPEQQERLVFCYRVYDTHVLYDLACGILSSCHYDFEISPQKDYKK